MSTTCGMLQVTAGALDSSSPGEVLEQVNQTLLARIPQNMFVTCFYAILQHVAMTLNRERQWTHESVLGSQDGRDSPRLTAGRLIEQGSEANVTAIRCRRRVRPVQDVAHSHSPVYSQPRRGILRSSFAGSCIQHVAMTLNRERQWTHESVLGSQDGRDSPRLTAGRL